MIFSDEKEQRGSHSLERPGKNIKGEILQDERADPLIH